MNKIGFDNDCYVKLQSEHIRERISKFGGKLYLEFGGKLFDDYHASRVLPGFKPDSKVSMLKELKDEAEIIIVVNSGDIEKNKVRGDLGITYDMDVLRLRDEFQNRGLMVGSVVITHYQGQAAADIFKSKLEKMYDDLAGAMDTPSGKEVELEAKNVLLKPVEAICRHINGCENLLFSCQGEALGLPEFYCLFVFFHTSQRKMVVALGA